jgi:hypothetical protein
VILFQDVPQLRIWKRIYLASYSLHIYPNQRLAIVLDNLNTHTNEAGKEKWPEPERSQEQVLRGQGSAAG